MRTWRSVINAILGKVPGKTSRLEYRKPNGHGCGFQPLPNNAGVLPSRERDDRRLVKRAGPLADVDPLEELIRIVNEAHERDTEDERRLYHPMRGYRPMSFQRRRPDRR